MILEVLILVQILLVLPSFLIFNCSPSAVSFSFEISLAHSAVVTVRLWLKPVILHLNYCNNLRAVFSASSPLLITMHGSGEGCQQNELPDVLFSVHPSPAAGTIVSTVSGGSSRMPLMGVKALALVYPAVFHLGPHFLPHSSWPHSPHSCSGGYHSELCLLTLQACPSSVKDLVTGPFWSLTLRLASTVFCLFWFLLHSQLVSSCGLLTLGSPALLPG